MATLAMAFMAVTRLGLVVLIGNDIFKLEI